MTREGAWRSAIRFCTGFIAAVAAITVVSAASIMVSGWLINGVERTNGSRRAAAERSALGDYFGAASAVFSGIALLLLVATILFQHRELQFQRAELTLQRDELAATRAELRRSAAADLRSLHVQLTQMQMDDPSLAEVWNDYPGQPHDVLREYSFANLIYGHFLLLYEWGGVTEAEVLAHAQRLVRGPAFCRYWAASRDAKAALPPESAEGHFFRLFDRAVSEALRQQSAQSGR